MESHQAIEAEVARWLVRRDAGNWSESDQRALTLWLEGSSARVVAYIRLEAAWTRLQRLKSLGAGTPKGSVPSPHAWQLSRVFEQSSQGGDVTLAAQPLKHARFARPLTYAVAASVALCLCIGLAAKMYLFDATSYRTPVGGIASVPLDDGSKITLNTDSKIRVALTDTERRVQLEQGEAFFAVAKDPNRPFVVTAGKRRVIAVGTAFSVRRGADDSVRVVVTEGTVRIEPVAPALDKQKSPGILLPAGDVALTREDHVMLQHKPLREVEETLSWRAGYLVFNETPLLDVVAEFNRYNVRKIVVDSDSLPAIRLSGRFEARQNEAFIRLLEDGFPIRAVSEGERVVLTAR